MLEVNRFERFLDADAQLTRGRPANDSSEDRVRPLRDVDGEVPDAQPVECEPGRLPNESCTKSRIAVSIAET